jgi:alpha-beta hydrolase superfamily lysophospholipase
LKKIFGWILALACSAYLLATAWLYHSQRSLLYFPQPLLAIPQANSFDIESKGLRRHGWVINPGQPRALLYLGGSGESVERDEVFFRDTMPGISVYLIPYRGYSGNPGSPTETDLFADALQDYDYIAARHAAVDVMGRSLGSGVAVYVAVHRKVGHLILTTPYDSIVNLAQDQYPYFPVRWLMKDKFESWRRAALIATGTLVLIAGDDQVVPRTNTDNLISHMKLPPHVVVIDHATHSTIIGKAEYADAIRIFLAGPN